MRRLKLSSQWRLLVEVSKSSYLSTLHLPQCLQRLSPPIISPLLFHFTKAVTVNKLLVNILLRTNFTVKLSLLAMKIINTLMLCVLLILVLCMTVRCHLLLLLAIYQLWILLRCACTINGTMILWIDGVPTWTLSLTIMSTQNWLEVRPGMEKLQTLLLHGMLIPPKDSIWSKSTITIFKTLCAISKLTELR